MIVWALTLSIEGQLEHVPEQVIAAWSYKPSLGDLEVISDSCYDTTTQPLLEHLDTFGWVKVRNKVFRLREM